MKSSYLISLLLCLTVLVALSATASADIRVLSEQEQSFISGGMCMWDYTPGCSPTSCAGNYYYSDNLTQWCLGDDCHDGDYYWSCMLYTFSEANCGGQKYTYYDTYETECVVD